MTLETQYSFRARMVESLTKDIIGPQAEDEVLDDFPLQAYISGILYPRSSEPMEPAADIDAADDDDEGQFDPAVAYANLRYPSSMGLTFALDPSVDAIRVKVSAAQYEEIGGASELSNGSESQEATEPDRSEAEGSGSSRRLTRWRRLPIGPTAVTLNAAARRGVQRQPIAPGLELYSNVRSADRFGAVPVTIILINTNTVTSGLRDAHCFFQTQMVLSGAKPSSQPFVERRGAAPPKSDEELNTFRLLYRHAASFARGHGCSAEWEESSSESGRTGSIWTSFAPKFDLLLTDSNPKARSDALTIRFLATRPREEVVPLLRSFAAGYEEWLSSKEQEAATLSDDLATAASRQVEAGRASLLRIQEGVDCLQRDVDVWRAFQLANRAMLIQRGRTEWHRSGNSNEGPITDDSHVWRPFQLAFVLLSLESIAEPRSSNRPIVDLLWFPTGGGKTEAYLTLIAFTVFLRRIRHGQNGDGLTALMRYTLRLLTIQQFERATLLICCCEYIRRNEPRLGDSPISIGLWVGQGATPNRLEDAEDALRRARRGQEPEEKNPLQLTRCPWCGAKLDHTNYFVTRSPRQLVIGCGKSECIFRSGLPVYVVDDDIYSVRPSLLVATVDKFAMLPWRPETSSLFNVDGPSPPPELIIQDELHLISGPLGTMTGLYETAVEALCRHEGVGPKVIASTATIRRAGQQTMGLFGSRVSQFPPLGLDARDSYFAVERAAEERGTRLYVGLSAPGTSQTTLMVRTYAALLQTAKELQAEDSDRDPYWTLVGYFNSLRVLGGARIQVQDDVGDRIGVFASRAGEQPRKIERIIELTSREPSKDIPGHLQDMAVEFPQRRAVDLILATNMISVGVDVDRLGLMVIMGQPQSTSEYIQASSRVGRRYPGLVVVLLNAAKSRDRSHYESFATYHSALYSQVESASVTPFSSRARDRGLHGVLIGLARLRNKRFRPNQAAAGIVDLEHALQAEEQIILERVERVSPTERLATEAHLRQIIARWRRRADRLPTLVYSKFREPTESLLVEASTDDPRAEGAFKTLQSLRDVDKSSNLYLEW